MGPFNHVMYSSLYLKQPLLTALLPSYGPRNLIAQQFLNSQLAADEKMEL